MIVATSFCKVAVGCNRGTERPQLRPDSSYSANPWAFKYSIPAAIDAERHKNVQMSEFQASPRQKRMKNRKWQHPRERKKKTERDARSTFGDNASVPNSPMGRVAKNGANTGSGALGSPVAQSRTALAAYGLASLIPAKSITTTKQTAYHAQISSSSWYNANGIQRGT